ncbi:MAG: hypothetical protein ACLPX1_10715 [Steroidobacteraceae bacterium]
MSAAIADHTFLYRCEQAMGQPPKKWARDQNAPLNASAGPKHSKEERAMNVAAVTIAIAAIGVRFNCNRRLLILARRSAIEAAAAHHIASHHI